MTAGQADPDARLSAFEARMSRRIAGPVIAVNALTVAALELLPRWPCFVSPGTGPRPFGIS